MVNHNKPGLLFPIYFPGNFFDFRKKFDFQEMFDFSGRDNSMPIPCNAR